MNQWFKIALYSFIGIILGTLVLGIMAPNSSINPVGGYNTYGYGSGYQQPMMYDNGMGMGRHGGMGMRGTR